MGCKKHCSGIIYLSTSARFQPLITVSVGVSSVLNACCLGSNVTSQVVSKSHLFHAQKDKENTSGKPNVLSCRASKIFTPLYIWKAKAKLFGRQHRKIYPKATNMLDIWRTELKPIASSINPPVQKPSNTYILEVLWHIFRLEKLQKDVKMDQIYYNRIHTTSRCFRFGNGIWQWYPLEKVYGNGDQLAIMKMNPPLSKFKSKDENISPKMRDLRCFLGGFVLKPTSPPLKSNDHIRRRKCQCCWCPRQ